MTERFFPSEPGGVTKSADGWLVRYDDYAALAAKLAEVEAMLDTTIADLHSVCIDGASATIRADAAEADLIAARGLLVTVRDDALEEAAKVAFCHSDRRALRYSMDWNDGYIDGCRGVAEAIRDLATEGKTNG